MEIPDPEWERKMLINRCCSQVAFSLRCCFVDKTCLIMKLVDSFSQLKGMEKGCSSLSCSCSFPVLSAA